MDYFDMLIKQRIDSRTADVVDQLLEQHLPALHPCAISLEAVLEQLKTRYILTQLPDTSIHYARTALSVIEAYFPEDASYLHDDWDRRLEDAMELAHVLHLTLFCGEIQDTGAGHELYAQQKIQYEQPEQKQNIDEETLFLHITEKLLEQRERSLRGNSFKI